MKKRSVLYLIVIIIAVWFSVRLAYAYCDIKKALPVSLKEAGISYILPDLFSSDYKAVLNIGEVEFTVQNGSHDLYRKWAIYHYSHGIDKILNETGLVSEFDFTLNAIPDEFSSKYKYDLTIRLENQKSNESFADAILKVSDELRAGEYPNFNELHFYGYIDEVFCEAHIGCAESVSKNEILENIQTAY